MWPVNGNEPTKMFYSSYIVIYLLSEGEISSRTKNELVSTTIREPSKLVKFKLFDETKAERDVTASAVSKSPYSLAIIVKETIMLPIN